MIGRTVGLVSSVGRAPDLQAGGRGFESCIGHTFSSLVYFSCMQVLAFRARKWSRVDTMGHKQNITLNSVYQIIFKSPFYCFEVQTTK